MVQADLAHATDHTFTSRTTLLTLILQRLKLANLNLVYMDNAKAAMSLLTDIQSELVNNKDNSLLGLKQAISDDLTRLQAVPVVPTAEIVMQLTSLQKVLPSLMTPSTTEQKAESKKGAQANSSLSHWQRFKHALADGLGRLVIIKHHDSMVNQLLAPQQKFMLIQIIQLELQQAKWAALRQDQSVYKHALANAYKLIEVHFNLDTQLKNRFNTLQQTAVKPDLPNLTQTIALTQALLTLKPKPTDKDNSQSNSKNEQVAP